MISAVGRLGKAQLLAIKGWSASRSMTSIHSVRSRHNCGDGLERRCKQIQLLNFLRDYQTNWRICVYTSGSSVAGKDEEHETVARNFVYMSGRKRTGIAAAAPFDPGKYRFPAIVRISHSLSGSALDNAHSFAFNSKLFSTASTPFFATSSS
jgi:hypothetical protein